MATWADVQKYMPTPITQNDGEQNIYLLRPEDEYKDIPGVGKVHFAVGNNNGYVVAYLQQGDGYVALEQGPGGSITGMPVQEDKGNQFVTAIKDSISDPKLWAVLGGGLAANAGLFGNLGSMGGDALAADGGMFGLPTTESAGGISTGTLSATPEYVWSEAEEAFIPNPEFTGATTSDVAMDLAPTQGLTQPPAPVTDALISSNAGVKPVTDAAFNAATVTGATGAGLTAAQVEAAKAAAPGVAGGASMLSRVLSGAGTASDYLALGLPLAGAALGGMSADQSPAGTTTTVQDLPDWLKPYVTGNLDAAQAYMKANPQDNSLLAPASAELNKTIAGDYLNSNPANSFFTGAMDYTNPGIDALRPGANGAYVGTNPSDPYYKQAAEYTNSSMDYLRPTAEGKFLNANPYIDAMYAKARDAVGTGIDSRFSKAGRYGSGAHQGVLGTTFDNLATDIYGNNYATERANMLSAGNSLIGADISQQAARLAGASGLGANYNTDRALQLSSANAVTSAEQAQQASRLAGASGLAGNYNTARGQQLTAATSAPGFTADAATSPFAAFNAFGNLTKGLGVSQTSSPYFTNPTAGALSGALAGYGLSKAFA